MRSSSSNPSRKSQGRLRITANPFAVLAQISKACGSTSADPKLELVASYLDKVNELEAMGLTVSAPPPPADKTGRGRPRSWAPQSDIALLERAAGILKVRPKAKLKNIAIALAKETGGPVEVIEKRLRRAWALMGYRTWVEFRRAILRRKPIEVFS
jgi:hypothetical protein